MKDSGFIAWKHDKTSITHFHHLVYNVQQFLHLPNVIVDFWLYRQCIKLQEWTLLSIKHYKSVNKTMTYTGNINATHYLPNDSDQEWKKKCSALIYTHKKVPSTQNIFIPFLMKLYQYPKKFKAFINYVHTKNSTYLS